MNLKIGRVCECDSVLVLWLSSLGLGRFDGYQDSKCPVSVALP